MAKESMKTLFFSPHMAIWQHSVPEAMIAKSLVEAGWDIHFLTCNSILSDFCVAMAASRLSVTSQKSAKKEICIICKHYRDVLLKMIAGSKKNSIEDYLLPNDTAEINELLAKLSKDNFDLEFRQTPIGRIALYETLLMFKKNNLLLTEIEWQAYLVSVRNCLLTCAATINFLNRHKIERVLIYNTLYGVNHTVMKIARARGIPVFFQHAGENISDRLSTLTIGLNDTINYRTQILTHWPQAKEEPCTQTEVSYIEAHFGELLKGQHFLAYSTASKRRFDIHEYFHISPEQKIIVATLSSYDERFAAESIGVLPIQENILFISQKDWIHELLEYVTLKPEYFLIIRVHPREFPNKRDSVHSKHAQSLLEEFKSLPINAAINWPTDQISLYDLAKSTSLFLNAWSSVGEEMSLLGIPVLLYSDKLILYPSNLNYLGLTTNEYFQQFEAAIKTGWQKKHTIDTFRWYRLKFCEASFRISDNLSILEQDVPRFSFLSRIINKLIRIFNKIQIIRIKLWPNLGAIPIRKLIRRLNNTVNGQEIARFLKENRPTRRDILPSRNISDDLSVFEEESIKSSLRRLMTLLFDPSSKLDQDSILYKNLKKFVESEIQS
jgi:hypothetical protein